MSAYNSITDIGGSRTSALINKLRLLAEQGVGGEAENARKIMLSIMKNHEISESDLELNKKVKRELKVLSFRKRICAQIACSVIGSENLYRYGNKRKNNTLIIDCGVSDFIEIKAKCDFYCQAYEQDERLFYKAFIHRNNLEALAAAPATNGEITKEDIKIFEMMSTIEKRIMHKQIEGKP
jgi:hypothetical protein